MANTRFNVTCPSCDADVPVRSSAAVGTKIECPTCKYRFTCPPPPAAEGAAPADSGAPTDEIPTQTDAAAKKKKAGRSTVLIGAVLGVLAVGVLIGATIVVLGDEDKPKVTNVPPKPAPPPPDVTPMPPDTNPDAGGGPEVAPPPRGPKEGPGTPVTPKPPEKEPTPPMKEPGAEVAKTPGKEAVPPKNAGSKTVRPPLPPPLELTNLLPGDTVAVYHVNMPQATKTPFYPAFFDHNVRELFNESFYPLKSDQIGTYVHGVVGPDRDSFILIRATDWIDDKSVVDRWQLTDGFTIPKGSPVNGKHYFYGLKANPFLMAVGGAATPDSLLGLIGVRPPASATRKAPADKMWAVYFPDDRQTMVIAPEPVLEKFLTDLQPTGYPPFQTEVAEPKAPAPKKDGAAGAAGTAAADPMPMPMPGATPMPGAAPMPPNGKKDAGPGKLYTSVRNYQSINPDLKRTLNALEEDRQNPPALLYAEQVDQRRTTPNLDPPLARYLPLSAGLLESVKFVGASLTEFSKDKLSAKVSLEFTTEDGAKTAVHQRILPSLFVAMPFVDEMIGTHVYLVNRVSAPPPPPPPGPNDPFKPPPPPLPGLGGFGVSGYPIGVVPGGGEPPMPTNTPGGVPMPMTDPMPMPGVPGQPPMPPGAIVSTVTVTLTDRVVNVAGLIGWNEEKYASRLMPLVTRAATQLRGKMAVLSGQTDWHSLATVAPKLTTRGKPFPVGTLDRKPVGDRFRLPHPPEQRVSFFADLLPFVGRSGLQTQIQYQKYPWYAKENLPAAQAWVPEFLVPYYPPSSWRPTSPLAADAGPLGGTNFVGLAGLGLDAARYNPANPEHAKKVGITGYDWGSTAADVKDGLSNTAYLVQVPPTMPRPWIAGGGSTVVGVEDSDAAMVPFVDASPNGRGTYLLMADGSVRFLREGTNPAIFRALVTRAGGEAITDLDKTAPALKPTREVELRGGGQVGGVIPRPGGPGN